VPVQPTVASVTRWGDAVYQLALLLADDRSAARQLTVAAFRRARQADAAGIDPESALYDALLAPLRTRRLCLRLPRRSQLLPPAWAVLPPLERALLGLWLLRGLDGARLARLAHLAPAALTARLAAALAPALDAPPADELQAWLAAALGFAPATPAYVLDADTRAVRAARQQRLDRLAATLRDAVANTHLPPACADAIDAHDDEPGGSWRRSPLWGAALLAGVLGLVVLVVAPWRGRAAPAAEGAAPAVDTPTAVVQQALDSWLLAPGDATRHRRVWAVEDGFAGRARLLQNVRAFRTPQPHIMDIWIDPAGAGFRWEVTRDKQTVEWILGDGAERLDYAVNTPYSACEWIDAGVTGRTALRFDAPPELQHEVFQTRQTLGAYGLGYRALQDARAAGDLRSYGRRIEGSTRLIALGYTASDGRNMVLLFDAHTRQLRAVREVAAQGSQATARDLWRLELDETIENTLPHSRPDWVNGRALLQPSLLDPSCPELRPDHVVSLRSLAGRNLWWGQPYVPRELPPGIQHMVLINPTKMTPGSFSPQDLRLLMVGPDRWMRIRMGQGGLPPTESQKIGVWDVTVDDDDGLLRASLCRLIVVSPENRFCSPALDLVATGWTEAELPAVIEQLTPVQPDNWRELDGLFVDGAPLAPETAQLLMRAVDAALPPANGVVHTELASESRVDPQRPVWQDPYHVPLDILEPQRVRQRQWLRYEGGALLERRDEQLAPDGTLLSAFATDGSISSSYQRSAGSLGIQPDSVLFGSLSAIPLELALILPLLESTEPITVSTVPEGIMLRQPAETALTNWGWSSWFVATPWTGDLEGRLERRVWLEPAGARPLKSELLMIDDAGAETLLNRATIAQHSSDVAMPEGSLVDPAALPQDTLVYRREDPAQPPNVGTVAGLQLRQPERVLVLPDIMGHTLRTYRADANIDQALFSGIFEIDQTGVTDVRRYEQLGGIPWLDVRQGPRDLLAHVLRSTMRGSIRDPGYTRTSEPVAVTIDGRPSTAWLIQHSSQALLVAEQDGVLLTVSGPDAEALRGPVLEALARMVWQTK